MFNLFSKFFYLLFIIIILVTVFFTSILSASNFSLQNTDTAGSYDFDLNADFVCPIPRLYLY